MILAALERTQRPIRVVVSLRMSVGTASSDDRFAGNAGINSRPRAPWLALTVRRWRGRCDRAGGCSKKAVPVASTASSDGAAGPADPHPSAHPGLPAFHRSTWGSPCVVVAPRPRRGGVGRARRFLCGFDSGMSPQGTPVKQASASRIVAAADHSIHQPQESAISSGSVSGRPPTLTRSQRHFVSEESEIG
jgi:hypothetical protein